MTLVYDPRDPDTLRAPHAIFAALRETEPTHWEQTMRAWVVTDYQGCQEVVASSTKAGLSADRIAPFIERLPSPERDYAAEIAVWLNRWAVMKDVPDHARLRKHLMRVINPRVVGDMRPSVESMTTMLLDRLPAGETVDFLDLFAKQLPSFVVLDLLGVPLEHVDEVAGYGDDLMLFLGSSRNVDSVTKYERARAGMRGLVELFQRIIAERRAEPRQDIISALIASDLDGDQLTDDEITASLAMLGNGAQTTTAHLFANSIIALLADPDSLAALRGKPEIPAGAVEELLRFDGPVLSIGRVAAADVTVGGQEIRQGDRVFAMLTAANRDPAIFSDPDVLDFERHPNPHMAFGKGSHFCLGAPLARLELQLGLAAVLERFPNLTLAEDIGQIPWTDNLTSRGPTRLPLMLRT